MQRSNMKVGDLVQMKDTRYPTNEIGVVIKNHPTTRRIQSTLG